MNENKSLKTIPFENSFFETLSLPKRWRRNSKDAYVANTISALNTGWSNFCKNDKLTTKDIIFIFCYGGWSPQLALL